MCSVGNWITYKPKSALQDVSRALGADYHVVMTVTKDLPDDFDDLTLEDHDNLLEKEKSPDDKERQEAHREVAKYKPFYDFRAANPQIVDMAFRMVGKIKAQGTHAGGLIIADRPIDEVVPLSLLGGNWTSQWTEGRSTQLSKFGLVKFDVLGLKTVAYIWQAGRLIEKTRGVRIDWDDMDPKSDPPRAGVEILPDGSRRVILLNDPDALRICNELKTDSVFQIETDIQKGIISDGKVKSFNDLVVYNALGRPGPLECIPEYIKRRDKNPDGWKKGEDARIVKILDPTFGIICYQEQLCLTWTKLAKFTVPEAEYARKIIAKKWVEKLPWVEQKWMKGATETIGKENAEKYWGLMISFGRYAFNYAHCLFGETILEDPITGERTTVANLYNNRRYFNLLSHQRQGLVADEVLDIHFNGIQPVYEIEFDTGIKQSVTLLHKFLCSDGIMRSVRDIILNSHSVKYICEEVRNEGNNRGRKESSRFISNGGIIQYYYFRNKEVYIRWDNLEDYSKVWCTEEIQNKNSKIGTQLFRNNRQTRKSLLDRFVNGRWICECNERQEICEFTIENRRFRNSHAVWERPKYQRQANNMQKTLPEWQDMSTTALICGEHEGCRRSKQVWSCSRQNKQRDCTKYIIYNRFSKRFSRWGWFYSNKWQGISNDQIDIFSELYLQIQRDYNKTLWCKMQQNNKIRQYDSNFLDWVRSMQENTVFYLCKPDSLFKKKENNCRCYIKSIKYIGIKPTYSPEMKSISHNYITEIKHGQPIHKNSVAYSLITYRCLYLKAHYPEEWWAAAMTHCHIKKLPSYMSAARKDGVKLGLLDANLLTHEFSVNEGMITPGLSSIKGIGEKASRKYTSIKGPFKGVDDFVEKCGKSKNTMIRLIQLGAFDKVCPNRKGLWHWYRYKYGTGKEENALRKEIKEKLSPPKEEIEKERQRQVESYQKLYPKKKKIPKKILDYRPQINPKIDEVVNLYKDYSKSEKLDIEKEFLGYYWSSPLGIYVIEGVSIEGAKEKGYAEVVVEKLTKKQSKNGNTYYVLQVTDGIQSIPVVMWSDIYDSSDRRWFRIGCGIKLHLTYNKNHGYRVTNNTHPVPLPFSDDEIEPKKNVVSEENDPLW